MSHFFASIRISLVVLLALLVFGGCVPSTSPTDRGDGDARYLADGGGAAHVPEDADVGTVDSAVAPPADAGPGPLTCADALDCRTCGELAGCVFCAGTGACIEGGGRCVHGAGADADACPGAYAPCEVASCWDPSTTLSRCRAAALAEDFSSGRFAVHRYSIQIDPDGPVDIRHARLGGDYDPALFITDDTGRLVHAGAPVTLHPSVDVDRAVDGRGSDAASVTLTARAATSLWVHVTSWDVVDEGFGALVPTDARYRVSFEQRCEGGAGTVHDGIERDGSRIPRAGLSNGTLDGALGVAIEPHGDLVTVDGLQWVRGTISWFGGPTDSGVSSTETGAITGERLRSLNNPLDPAASTIADRPEDYYFVAMRFDYTPGGRSFWRSARLLIRNPANGREVVVRPVDWGPHTRTARILDLSPQSLTDLGSSTDDIALVSFAVPGTPLGPVP